MGLKLVKKNKDVIAQKRFDLHTHSLMFDKDTFTVPEKAAEWADKNGYDVGKFDDIGKYYTYEQISRERFVEESLKEHQITVGVKAIVGTFKEFDDVKVDEETGVTTTSSSFDRIQDKIETESPHLSDNQVDRLSKLKEKYQKQLAELKARLNTFIPVLNEFIDLSANLVKDENKLSYLDRFTIGMEALTTEMNKITLPEFEEIDPDGVLENDYKKIKPIIVEVNKMFEDTSFTDFHDLTGYVLHFGDNVIDKVLTDELLVKNLPARKFKKVRKANVKVIDKTFAGNKKFTYSVGVMVNEKDVKKYSKISSDQGFNFVILGSTSPTDVRLEKGDIASIEIQELLVNKTSDKVGLSIVSADVIEKLEKTLPFTTDEIEKISLPSEVKKSVVDMFSVMDNWDRNTFRKFIDDENIDTRIFDTLCPEINKSVDKSTSPQGPSFGEMIFDENIKEGSTGKFVLHSHSVGKGQHYDLRMSVQKPNSLDYLAGLLISGSSDIGTVNALRAEIGSNKELPCTFKSKQSKNWLSVAQKSTVEVPSGGVGATRFKSAKISTIEQGTWLAGVQAKNFKEFIFKGKKGLLVGRFILSGTQVSSLTASPDAPIEKSFVFVRPKDQKLRSESQEQIRNMKRLDKDLVYWGTEEAIMGTTQSLLMEVAKLNNVERKFVTVEYPEKRFIRYLEENYKVESASYTGLDDVEYHGYVNLVVKGEKIDAFILDGKLIIFFDDKEEIEKILGYGEEVQNNPYLNYAPGNYAIEMTRNGYVLVPIENRNVVEPIFDEDIVKKLNIDTETFFTKRSWYKSQGIPHKRGILLYGPPGNGKTTFIKDYISKMKSDRYSILIDCSSYSPDGYMFDFLDKQLRDKAKVLVFEDVDTVASSIGRRSSFLNFLDGMSQLDNSLVIATTNYPERLDKALLKRTSRFDKKYEIGLPSTNSREKFLKLYFDYLEKDLLAEYAALTDGFTGSDFKELFILKNIQDTSIVDAIEQIQQQNMLFKSRRSENTEEEFEEKDIEFVKVLDENGVEKKEERIAYGIVLKPNDTDAHGDTYDEDTVVKAADFFMEHFANTGLMHKLIVNKRVKILQSYTAPANMTIVDMKGQKRKIKKGTWLFKVRILDDAIWENVKLKKLTGFSIGALATVRELKKLLKLAA